MTNVFTRVPDTHPPKLPWSMGPVIVLADGFMLLMISRPHTGSLGRTWVTPSTMWLAAIAGMIGVTTGAVLVSAQRSWIAWIGVGVLLWAAGAVAVAVVGVVQRVVARK